MEAEQDIHEDLVIYSVEDRVAHITLNRPNQRNALNQPLLRVLVGALNAADQDPAVWLIVITGAGDSFSSGHDLKEISSEDYHEEIGLGSVYNLIMNVSKPTIAAVNGPCIAGGSGLALSADMRVFAESASVGWPQVKLGVASVSGPAILTRLVPPNIAMEYLFTGKFMTARTAFELGMANRLVPDGQMEDAVNELAGEILEGAPLAIRAMKATVVAARDLSQREAMVRGQAAIDELMESDDAKEGLSAFKEKRQPSVLNFQSAG